MTVLEELVLGSTWVDGCLLWGGGRSGPYGRLHDEYVHRLMYREHYGSIPDGALIDHSCHNKTCINPSHIREADYSQNGWNRAGAAIHCRSGVRGVRRAGEGYALPWISQVVVRGVQHRRYFQTLEDAARGVEQMRAELLPADFVGRS